MTDGRTTGNGRGREFSRTEMRRIGRLPAVDKCTRKRITWNQGFARYVVKRLERGDRPCDLFRAAGVGSERIGYKRIERCVARWRKAYATDGKKGEPR